MSEIPSSSTSTMLSGWGLYGSEEFKFQPKAVIILNLLNEDILLFLSNIIFNLYLS